jgi:hypothetical protein
MPPESQNTATSSGCMSSLKLSCAARKYATLTAAASAMPLAHRLIMPMSDGSLLPTAEEL